MKWYTFLKEIQIYADGQQNDIVRKLVILINKRRCDSLHCTGNSASIYTSYIAHAEDGHRRHETSIQDSSTPTFKTEHTGTTGASDHGRNSSQNLLRSEQFHEYFRANCALLNASVTPRSFKNEMDPGKNYEQAMTTTSMVRC